MLTVLPNWTPSPSNLRHTLPKLTLTLELSRKPSSMWLPWLPHLTSSCGPTSWCTFHTDHTPRWLLPNQWLFGRCAANCTYHKYDHRITPCIIETYGRRGQPLSLLLDRFSRLAQMADSRMGLPRAPYLKQWRASISCISTRPQHLSLPAPDPFSLLLSSTCAS
jgi:hypothetical protein